MSTNNVPSVTNDGWETITKKVKQKNYDDVPVSFQKIKEERKMNAVYASKPQIQSKVALKTKSKNIESNNIMNKIDEGTFTHATVSGTLSKQIIKARQEKGWTQKEFATLCNLNVAIVKNYENGSGLPKVVEMNKMSSILGVNLNNK